jgi:branched-chain amino acid transport system permease protein
MDAGTFIIDLLNGLSRGMVYFLMASGLTLIFSVLGIINFAHGSLILLGAYMTWSLSHIVEPGLWFFVLVLLSGAVVGAIGILMEVFLVRRIYDAEHLYQLLLTFALIMIIDGGILEIWGGQPKTLFIPRALLGSVSIAGRPFPKYSLFLLLSSAIIAGLLWLFLAKTNLGLASRAAAADVEITSALGINVPLVYTATFAIGAALAGLSGATGLALKSLVPAAGAEIAVLCFAIIVIGGLGSLRGTLFSALIMGLFESFGDRYFPQAAMALPFIIMALILLIKPQGLFGKMG